MKKLLMLLVLTLITALPSIAMENKSQCSLQRTKRSYDLSQELEAYGKSQNNIPVPGLKRTTRCYDLSELAEYQTYQKKLQKLVKKENIPVVQQPEVSIVLTTVKGQRINLLESQSI